MSTGAGTDRDAGAAPGEPERAWRRVGALVARSYLWFLVVLVAWTAVPVVFGFQSLTVTSGSMLPALSPGTVVLTQAVAPSEIERGDIVATRPDRASDQLVTHRVDQLVDDSTIRTRGDANTVPDEPVARDEVAGRARLVVPFAGLPAVWAGGGRWELLGAWVALTLIAARAGLGGWVTSRRPPPGGSSGRRAGPQVARRRTNGRLADPGRRAGFQAMLSRRRSRRRRCATVATLGMVALLAGSVTVSADRALAAFSGSGAAAATLGGAVPLHPAYVDAANGPGPVGYWRLGDPVPDPVLLDDDFETFSGWSQERNGTVQAASSPTRSGTGSLRKTSNNDPNGGTTTLSRAVGNDWRMSTWVYRPDPWSGGAQDRISVEDSSGNGYGVRSIHNGTNRLQIERRTNASGATLATTNYAAPKNEWYRLELVREGTSITASAFDGAGTLLATVSDTDGAHSTFDTVAVRGGRDYYLDDLEVTTSPPTFADQTGADPAVGAGTAPMATAGLLVGDPDPAIDLGGDSRLDAPSRATLDGAVAARTVNAWVDTTATAGRGVVWTEGDAARGIVLYRDGMTLWGRAWAPGWPDDLELSGPLPSGRVMLTFAFSTSDGAAELFVDGALVDSVVAPPRGAVPSHPGATAIGGLPGSTRFHDGVSGGAGFDGVIDEVSVYPTRLDGATIAGLFGAGS